MLIRLAVRDLAVIAAAELELGHGFTVLTGETGAGKSLLVDALGLVLGDRGAAALVRTGAARAGVTAEFEVPPESEAHATLAARELPAEEVLILHRQIGADGRSRAWVNGVPVPLGVLRELGEALVEIHGQHEHHALARTAYQRRLLDAWAGAEAEAQAVAAATHEAGRARERLAAARATSQDRAARTDFLNFQLHELDALGPRDGEYQELMAEYDRLRHRERIEEALARAVGALAEGDAPAASALADARQALSRLPEGAGLTEATDLLVQAEALVAEATRRLQRVAETEADPERLDALNERIARYQALARKHSVAPEGLAGQREAFAVELADLNGGGELLERLEATLAEKTETWRRTAAALSRKREAAAPRFGQAVTAAARELGMPHAHFEARLEAVDTAHCPPAGSERVLFEITTNEGQPAGPIAQVASGGELSRLALAVEVLAAGAAGVPVMVFDEVDAGISGRVADLVGRRLKALAAHCQVLCVTHLPQVAALADHHFAITKTRRGHATAAEVRSLDAELRVEAIAEMLGGVRVTETARTHARELIERSASGRAVAKSARSGG